MDDKNLYIHMNKKKDKYCLLQARIFVGVEIYRYSFGGIGMLAVCIVHGSFFSKF